ncbi:gliding motility-associated ABC transporter substrate-binding protein GldG [Dyadobacter frigoris]|uniref:Gliding motility-associated ABC transporter substrate-binding protein GldG n=1 Tax=Dyadobacter frigoris TaxID=2576211 RepID=A0A4U6D3T9_9BACT|nr:gliding motility-associated ABC transporter substrate-binding protein GldG [Dyadobacter frigoris]TKT91316.1 gliding motility-associated ABC transporter substrate-binding protein GldG [Dyadobacter frigoris]GLU56323.1 gliding motility-associated ABC transporter substrate-binding protein GldG [Dyadobacter frigoris]
MKKTILRFLFVLIILAGVNWLASLFFFRWDLTEDKRYTISDATKRLLSNLDKNVIVNVYLSGEFPPGFERLESATRETLEEFKTYSNGHLSFQFSDPSDAASEDERKKQYQNLVDRGLTPTNLFANEDGKRTEKLIFPGAIVQADTLAIPVQLLKGNKSSTPEEQLNQSYENVEFQLASAIRVLDNPAKKKVGLLVNHTQKLPPARLSDLIATMQQSYDVFMVVNDPETYEGLDALMILKPDVPFSEEEKYKLDQYVIGGGKALFFVDGAKVDSVSLEGNYVQPLDLNLNDLFFRWGARINNNLVKDLNCATIPMNIGNMGDKPEIKAVPWRFFPLLNNFGPSPITRNTDAVYSRFLSSLDTVGGAPGIQKIPLLMTSPYTNLVNTPALVGYNEARQQPDPAEYKGGVKLAAVLLEGTFNSLFENRILPNDPRSKTFKPTGQGKIIICADGDVVVNDYDYRRNTPLPLGYDRASSNIFGNKDFVMHALDYMTDENGIINSRSKQISIRALDKIAVHKDKKFWQALNLLLPLVILGIFGAIRYYIRKRKFA